MNTYNLFISHSWTYSEQYNRVVRTLGNRPYFRFANYSVPKDDPIHGAGTDAQLREAIRNHMMPCHVILILAGVYARYSKWINKEIHLAQQGFRQPKPIIAVEPFGSERTSRDVKDAANRTVKCHRDSILSAIREVA